MYYHVVDLGDHQGGEDTFARLYGMHPNEFRALFARRGLPINMMRAPDLCRLFEDQFEVTPIPLLVSEGLASVAGAHPYWPQNHDLTDVSVEVLVLKATPRAFVACKQPVLGGKGAPS